MSFCTHCGAELTPGGKFCTMCGAPVTGAPSADALAPPATSGPGKGRALLVGGLVAAGLILAAALVALGPETPKPASPPASASAPPANAPPPATPPAPSSPTTADAPPAAHAGPITASRWEHYVNTRYGVGIDYPADLFAADPPPPDNAGRGFEANAAKARFSIYSHANALDASRDELQAEDVLELGDASAEKLAGDTWYAVIATTDREVIVRRVLLSEENTFVHRLEIAYPKASANAFKPIVARMMQSFSVDPSIPEKAAEAADAADRAVSPSAKPGHAAAPTAKWQSIDSIRLGLRAPGARGSAGVALQIPANWTRVAARETFLLEFGAPASAGGRLRLLIEAIRITGRFSFGHEVAAITSVIKPGVDDYHEQIEADVTVAGRPAQRLTLSFIAMDDPAPQLQEYLLVRAGDTLFKILVDGPERNAADIRSVSDGIIATLAVAE